MAQHISVRVPWHDDVWDGTVCQNPGENNACLRLTNISEKRMIYLNKVFVVNAWHTMKKIFPAYRKAQLLCLILRWFALQFIHIGS